MGEKLRMEFTHLGCGGTVLVECGQNPGPQASGFDALGKLPFDVEMCRLYPTVNARVDTYKGTGYRKLMGWIQLVTRWDCGAGEKRRSTTIDTGEWGNPFFAMGYPPELYDAPCNNLGESEKLLWVAEAFLTTVPSRMNGQSIAFLAGFQWGYEEYDVEGARRVDSLPAKQLDGFSWNAHMGVLRRQFPAFTYLEYRP